MSEYLSLPFQATGQAQTGMASSFLPNSNVLDLGFSFSTQQQQQQYYPLKEQSHEQSRLEYPSYANTNFDSISGTTKNVSTEQILSSSSKKGDANEIPVYSNYQPVVDQKKVSETMRSSFIMSKADNALKNSIVRQSNLSGSHANTNTSGILSPQIITSPYTTGTKSNFASNHFDFSSNVIPQQQQQPLTNFPSSIDPIQPSSYFSGSTAFAAAATAAPIESNSLPYSITPLTHGIIATSSNAFSFNQQETLNPIEQANQLSYSTYTPFKSEQIHGATGLKSSSTQEPVSIPQINHTSSFLPPTINTTISPTSTTMYGLMNTNNLTINSQNNQISSTVAGTTLNPHTSALGSQEISTGFIPSTARFTMGSTAELQQRYGVGKSQTDSLPQSIADLLPRTEPAAPVTVDRSSFGAIVGGGGGTTPSMNTAVNAIEINPISHSSVASIISAKPLSGYTPRGGTAVSSAFGSLSIKPEGLNTQSFSDLLQQPITGIQSDKQNGVASHIEIIDSKLSGYHSKSSSIQYNEKLGSFIQPASSSLGQVGASSSSSYTAPVMNNLHTSLISGKDISNSALSEHNKNPLQSSQPLSYGYGLQNVVQKTAESEILPTSPQTFSFNAQPLNPISTTYTNTLAQQVNNYIPSHSASNSSSLSAVTGAAGASSLSGLAYNSNTGVTRLSGIGGTSPFPQVGIPTGILNEKTGSSNTRNSSIGIDSNSSVLNTASAMITGSNLVGATRNSGLISTPNHAAITNLTSVPVPSVNFTHSINASSPFVNTSTHVVVPSISSAIGVTHSPSSSVHYAATSLIGQQVTPAIAQVHSLGMHASTTVAPSGYTPNSAINYIGTPTAQISGVSTATNNFTAITPMYPAIGNQYQQSSSNMTSSMNQQANSLNNNQGAIHITEERKQAFECVGIVRASLRNSNLEGDSRILETAFLFASASIPAELTRVGLWKIIGLPNIISIRNEIRTLQKQHDRMRDDDEFPLRITSLTKEAKLEALNQLKQKYSNTIRALCQSGRWVGPYRLYPSSKRYSSQLIKSQRGVSKEKASSPKKVGLHEKSVNRRQTNKADASVSASPAGKPSRTQSAQPRVTKNVWDEIPVGVGQKKSNAIDPDAAYPAATAESKLKQNQSKEDLLKEKSESTKIVKHESKKDSQVKAGQKREKSSDVPADSIVETPLPGVEVEPIVHRGNTWDEVPIGVKNKKGQEADWSEYPDTKDSSEKDPLLHSAAGTAAAAEGSTLARDQIKQKKVISAQKQKHLESLNRRTKYNPMKAAAEAKRIIKEQGNSEVTNSDQLQVATTIEDNKENKRDHIAEKSSTKNVPEKTTTTTTSNVKQQMFKRSNLRNLDKEESDQQYLQQKSQFSVGDIEQQQSGVGVAAEIIEGVLEIPADEEKVKRAELSRKKPKESQQQQQISKPKNWKNVKSKTNTGRDTHQIPVGGNNNNNGGVSNMNPSLQVFLENGEPKLSELYYVEDQDDFDFDENHDEDMFFGESRNAAAVQKSRNPPKKQPIEQRAAWGQKKKGWEIPKRADIVSARNTLANQSLSQKLTSSSAMGKQVFYVSHTKSQQALPSEKKFDASVHSRNPNPNSANVRALQQLRAGKTSSPQTYPIAPKVFTEYLPNNKVNKKSLQQISPTQPAEETLISSSMRNTSGVVMSSNMTSPSNAGTTTRSPRYLFEVDVRNSSYKSQNQQQHAQNQPRQQQNIIDQEQLIQMQVRAREISQTQHLSNFIFPESLFGSQRKQQALSSSDLHRATQLMSPMVSQIN